MPSIIDTNQIATNQITHLKADGIKTVIRYISPINPRGSKTIQPDEAHALEAAGIRVGLVCEGWGDFAHGAISAGAGERDGAFCPQYAAAVGAPKNTCIYYAVDVDASQLQISRFVLPYFASVYRERGDFRVGVYGSGDVCNAVLKAGFADLAWLSCSMGWSGSRLILASPPPQLVLRQHPPVTLANLDCDPDDALASDIGDFLPFAPVPEAAAEA